MMRNRGRRQKRKIIIPIASMGDIAFLLIIFFMVCSNFAKESNIELQPPESPLVERLKQSMISVVIDVDGEIYHNGQRTYSADAVESQVSQILEGRPHGDERIVLFRCDRGIDKDIYEPVLDAIAGAGGIIAAVGEQPR